jgi:hypothetical protein
MGIEKDMRTGFSIELFNLLARYVRIAYRLLRERKDESIKYIEKRLKDLGFNFDE